MNPVVTAEELLATARAVPKMLGVSEWDQLSAHARDVYDSFGIPEGPDREAFVHVAVTVCALLWPSMHAQGQAAALRLVAALESQS